MALLFQVLLTACFPRLWGERFHSLLEAGQADFVHNAFWGPIWREVHWPLAKEMPTDYYAQLASGRLEQLPRAGDAPFHFGWGLQLL